MKTTGDAYVDRARSTPHKYSPGPGGRCNDCRLTRNSPIHLLILKGLVNIGNEGD